MKRFRRTLPSALLAMAAATVVRSEQGGPGPRGPWGHSPLHQMEKCLATMDLPASLRTDLDNTLASAHVTLKTDGEALRNAHTQMQADLDNAADKATLGQDTLDVDAAQKKLRADGKTIHDQILAQLSPDQQDTLRACASAHDGHGRGSGGPGPSSQAPPQ